MEQQDKDKWAPFLDKMNISEDRKDWVSEYVEIQSACDGNLLNQSAATQTGTSSNTLFPQLFFPIARSISASLMGGDPKLLEAAKNKVIAVNRERQIEDILEDKNYIPLKIEDTEEYKEYQKGGLVSINPMSGPKMNLMYLDFVYTPKKIKRKFRRPGYKRK